MSPHTRDRIIAATNELFRRKGYTATSLAEIGHTANATTGSIYHFFPGGKADLARAVIIETGGAYLELFELVTAGAPDPGSAVETFFDGAAATLEESGYIDVCPIGTVAREVASTNPELREAADQVFNTWVAALAERLAGSGAPDHDATGLATAVIGMLEGGFVLARARQDGDVLRDMGSRARQLIDDQLERIHARATRS